MGSNAFRPLADFLEQLTPLTLSPSKTSITISLSKRFFLFRAAKRLVKSMESVDPYLNFISVLKTYKALGKFLTGNIAELHRDRNKSYFRHFFADKELYSLVKSDLEWVYEASRNQHAEQLRDCRLTIMKNGLLIYDNYRKNKFNILLLTVHSGTWMPRRIQAKQSFTKEQRALEEDIGVHRLYGGLFLAKGGIWIDCKFSRFACDLNRSPAKAIYSNNSENWSVSLWKNELSRHERRALMAVYDEFYLTLEHIVDAYKFNILFDAHSMKDGENRAEISFGTKFIPKFYMPVIRSMQKKMLKLGHSSVMFNAPYRGGHILQWLSNKFPDLFIFSMEVNKKLYMDAERKKVDDARLDALSKSISNIFELEEDGQ